MSIVYNEEAGDITWLSAGSYVDESMGISRNWDKEY